MANINVPIVPGRFAARAVIYNEQRGGYIDNRRASFARTATDPAIVSYFNGVVPSAPPVLVAKDAPDTDVPRLLVASRRR